MSLLRYAALALTAGALLHVVGLLMGPDAIAFLGAPPDVVQSVEDKTLYGPSITLAIAALLAGLAWLAWRSDFKGSSSKITRLVLWVFTVIFTLRGLLTFLFIPMIMTNTTGPSPVKFWFHIGAGLFVLSIGVALGLGLWKTKAQK